MNTRKDLHTNKSWDNHEYSVRISLISNDHSRIEKAVSAIILSLISLKKSFKGPIPLPKKINKLILPRSPHKHSSSKEQFGEVIHHRSIIIYDNKRIDMKQLVEMLRSKEVPSVVIRFKLKKQNAIRTGRGGQIYRPRRIERKK